MEDTMTKLLLTLGLISALAAPALAFDPQPDPPGSHVKAGDGSVRMGDGSVRLGDGSVRMGDGSVRTAAQR